MHLQCQAPGSIWNLAKSPPGALPGVRLHWEDESARERGRDALLRCRINFLPLLRHGQWLVLEVNGSRRYISEDGQPDQASTRPACAAAAT